MIREVDQYFAAGLERLVEAVLFTPKEQWSKSAIDAGLRTRKKAHSNGKGHHPPDLADS